MNAAELVDDTQSVVQSVSIENMLRQRTGVLDRISRAIDLLEEARTIALAAGVGFPSVELSAGNRRWSYRASYVSNTADAKDIAQKDVDQGAWRHLMNESGLRTLMDATARAEWDEQLDKFKFPDLTAENIRATFQMLHATRGDMFDRGVIRCFKQLSWDYKTNNPFRFGKRIILNSLQGRPREDLGTLQRASPPTNRG
jgi:Domain of unknown function (DUF4942)